MLVARRVAESPTPKSADSKFALLRRAVRVWAVPAIHGEAARLAALHAALEGRFEPGDRLVYLGNYFGHGADIAAMLDELLRFRRLVLARPLMFAFDLVYLRGGQEEMWQKLLQLQFAVNPRQVFDWMLGQGADATIRAYGGDPARGRLAMAEGPMAIGRWTGELRQRMAARPGHQVLMTTLRRAAQTDDGRLLFVHAGLDPARPLAEQGDRLWWGHAGWAKITAPYAGFSRVIRGYGRDAQADPSDHALTIDAGCGFGGPLAAVCLAPNGEILEHIDV
jgi:serine/threonine protein phosphatase 1